MKSELNCEKLCENKVISKMGDTGDTKSKTKVTGVDNRGATGGKYVNFGVND